MISCQQRAAEGLKPRTLPVVILVGFLLAALLPALAAEEIARVGLGSYSTVLPPGRSGPTRQVYRTANVSGPLPTNRWWSSVLWTQYSERQYPHPLAVRARASGLQIYYPGSRIQVNETNILGTMPDGTRHDMLLEHSGCESFPDARLDGYSDWFVKVLFERDAARLRVAYGHGSPFVFAAFENGEPRLRFERPPLVWALESAGAIVGITVENAHYAIFGPPGFRWEGMKTDAWSGSRGGDCFLSIAVLPDQKPATLKLFSQYAYNHVSDTKVRWDYDRKTSAVSAAFDWKTVSVESPVPRAEGTLFCLYPHQWSHTQHPLLDLSYSSVRGSMKLAAGTSFTTTVNYSGVLPVLPNRLQNDLEVRAAIVGEAARGPQRFDDSYWVGKRLGKLATLADIADQLAMPAQERRFVEELRTTLEAWLRADDAGRKEGPAEFLYYDDFWGTLIGYPASHGTDVELNDHHLHHGYFLMAAAALARRDPQWAERQNWGDMVGLLVGDIACSARDDTRFPFLRCFDAYAGHSWASGHAKFADGNNSESSSEAIQSWCGLILWAAATNDAALLDLGVFVYATEVEAAKTYWFDVLDRHHEPAYQPTAVGQLWGGKGAYHTWFSPHPEAIHGINWLPFHGGSLYLGHHVPYVAKVHRALGADPTPNRQREWGDLVAMYVALHDPAGARALLEKPRQTGEFEKGNSLAQSLYWISNLERLGTVNGAVRANHPFYAVFDKPGQRTYSVYNFQDQPLTVLFSDGVKVSCLRRGFTNHEGSPPAAQD